MFVNVAFKRSAEGGFYNLPQVDTRPSDKHAPKLDIHTYICMYIYIHMYVFYIEGRLFTLKHCA